MRSLTDLGNDILVMIFDLLSEDASPRTLHSLSMVNSHFSQLARYQRCRTLRFNVSDDVGPKFASIEQHGLWHAVRRITVTGEGRGVALDLLQATLPQMTGLRDLELHTSCIPAALLDALRAHRSRIRLHARVTDLRHRSRRPPTREETNLARLRGCPNLHALDVRATYVRAAECLEVTRPLREILLTCANLRALRLRVGQPAGGCVIYSAPPEYCGFGFAGGERPAAALEELDLVEYPFGREDWDDADPDYEYYSKENQVGYPGRGYEPDYWAAAFDWSRLRHLRTYHDRMVFDEAMLRQLTALREVEFTNVSGGADDEHRRFYAEVPAALESIRVQHLAHVGVAGLARHGRSLRALSIHREEDWGRQERSHWHEAAALVDAAALQQTRAACPRIEELTVDVARDGAWPWTTLDELAAFPALRSLTVWWELGVADGNNPVRPYATFAATRALLERVLGIRERRGLPRLRDLVVRSGAPPEVGHGLVAEEAFWPEYNSTAFRCTLAERDDEAALGRYAVECCGLNARGNAILRRAAETGEDPEDILAAGEGKGKGTGAGEEETGEPVDLESLRVAWHGPTPVSQWDAHY
ncbi:hypothetical protein F4779DRAFT_638395 [Xylariaceae sp. FL0662B]|nr:hypothetical protein F4779DRAFT_638395 [Xylariaceae sp. FL0662B]